MTLDEIRSKSIEELIAIEKELKTELAKLYMKKNMGIREAANKISSTRKSIARVKTIIVEKKKVENNARQESRKNRLCCKR
jgi:ribosomal protein L29